MKTFAASLVAASVSAAITSNDLKFMNFIAEHGKSYETIEEYNVRSALWSATEDFISIENSKGNNFTLGHNFMSDMTKIERSNMLGYIPSSEAREE